jgi:hypothetical protein
MPPTPPTVLTDFDSSRCPDFNPNTDFTACTYFDPASNILECGYCKQTKYYRCLAHNAQIPLSHSSVQSFLSCHYLYYLQALRGIQTRDAQKSSPLKMGSLWDTVLQKHLGQPDIKIADTINKYEISDRDIAKVKGLFRAYKFLEIQVDPGYELQAKIDLSVTFDHQVWNDGVTPVRVFVTGFYDRKYPTHFVENKLSGRPENYLDPYYIQSQVGTYFLADPSLEHCTMEVVRTPDLKSAGKNKEEDADTYSERVYQDVLSRPSHYFIGYNNETRRYGKKYYRTEFNLEELKSRYTHIFREYWEARLLSGWYKNDRACRNILPGIQCEYIPLCRNNQMSETIFQIRQQPVAF